MKMIETTKPIEIMAYNFLSKAISKDDSMKKILHYVKSESGVAYSTDGRRMHKVKVEGLPEGLLEIRKVNSRKAEVCILEEQVKEGLQNYPGSLEGFFTAEKPFKALSSDFNKFVFKLLTETGLPFNIEFLKDIHTFVTNYSDNGLDKPTVFQNSENGNSDFFAAVMPLRIQE